VAPHQEEREARQVNHTSGAVDEGADRVSARRHRTLQLAAAAGWALLVLPLAAMTLSIGLSPQTNWTLRAVIAGFYVLAIARPDAALLVTSALVGFGIILAHLIGVPTLRTTEVLVVVSLTGCCVGAARRAALFRQALCGWIAVPVALLAVAAVASTAVWLRVDQFRTGYAAAYVQRFLQVLTHDYFVAPGDFWVVVSTAVILEGLALFVFVAALCRNDPTFFPRALRMLVVGGAALGVMSVVRLGEILLRNPDALAALRASSIGLRISPQIPDYIAAGAYFALCWLGTLGLSVASPPRRRSVWLATGLPLIAALFLTGSRSVIAAALAGLVFVMFAVARRRAAPGRRVVVFAVLALAVMVGSYQQVIGRDAVGQMARQSVTVRLELLEAGWHVIATRPLFGVGLDRFYLVAPAFASPTLRALWPGRMNPHNDFLRFGGELGLVGLVLFVWILGEAWRRIWKALQITPDVRLAGLAGGIVAFLVTSCVSNPLMVREVSYVFWIALGLAVGRATAPLPQAVAPEPISLPVRTRASRLRWLVVVPIGGALVLSVPSRAATELANINVSRVSYGFFEWGADADGTPSRWSGPRATLFVDGRARSVEIWCSGAAPAGVLQQVEVRLDGRLANRVAVGTERQRLRLVLPATGSVRPRRIDLTVTPTWIPAQMIPGNQDRRELGVKVGEIKVIM
jgi:hypothetical protein